MLAGDVLVGFVCFRRVGGQFIEDCRFVGAKIHTIVLYRLWVFTQAACLLHPAVGFSTGHSV